MIPWHLCTVKGSRPRDACGSRANSKFGALSLKLRDHSSNWKITLMNWSIRSYWIRGEKPWFPVRRTAASKNAPRFPAVPTTPQRKISQKTHIGLWCSRSNEWPCVRCAAQESADMRTKQHGTQARDVEREVSLLFPISPKRDCNTIGFTKYFICFACRNRQPSTQLLARRSSDCACRSWAHQPAYFKLVRTTEAYSLRAERLFSVLGWCACARDLIGAPFKDPKWSTKVDRNASLWVQVWMCDDVSAGVLASCLCSS